MYQIDVRKFMDACDQPSDQGMGEQAVLYMDLIEDQYNQIQDAFYSRGDIAEVSDSLANMVWVIMGLVNTLGIPFDEAWREVRESNRSKCNEL
jgi:predicted HAD superfamily Cof-like phosphohydrolase